MTKETSSNKEEPTATKDESGPATETHTLETDIAELRGRFTDTRELYLEVCALLFFRYKITPTANKLYNLVRKGTMGTPADVLSEFWQNLRDKSRVRIEHGDMPDTLKDIAAEAVLTIWHAASSATNEKLATLRVEDGKKVALAMEASNQAVEESRIAQQATAAVQVQLDAVRKQLGSLQEVLSAERQAHSATEARLQEMRKQLEERDRQIADARIQFSTELEHARQQVMQAEERAAGTERRVMREFDQERTLRQKSDRAADELRTELTAARTDLQESAVRHADIAARHQAEIQGLELRLGISDAEREKLVIELANGRTELANASRRAERAEAEVEVTRRLVENIRKGPAEKPTRKRGPSE